MTAVMQTRHRIPTIFSLSMVDVLCCALGCVILLWLVNSREAQRRAVAAGDTTKLLEIEKGRVVGLNAQLVEAQSRSRALGISLNEKTLAQLDLQKLLDSKTVRLVTLEEALK